MNDFELLERHRAGSHDAFEELVRRHVNWVHSVARRRVRDTHRAEDVTQVSFTTLYRKPPRLKAGQTLSLWLFTVVNHAALDALRSEARRRRRETEAARMKGDLTTSETSQWAEFEPYLDELVGGLSEEDRQAVLLRYYEQKPFAEVGAALRVSEEAARKRVDRATDKLRGMLEARGVKISMLILAGVLTAQVTQAAPAALATSIAIASATKTTVMGKAVEIVSSVPGQLTAICLIVAWLVIAARLAELGEQEQSITTNAVTHIAAAEYVPIPGWLERFDRVYRLEPGEVLKNIQNPRIPERAVYTNLVLRGDVEMRMTELWPGAGLSWDHGSQKIVRGGGGWVGFYSNSLVRILNALGVKPHEQRGSDEWLTQTLDGDWIFSLQASVPERLTALSGILRDRFQRRVRFENRPTQERVIVVRGDFEFKSLPGARTTSRGPWIHVHAGTFDPKLSIVDWRTLPEFLKSASSSLRIRFVDETKLTHDPGELTVTWHRTAISLFNAPSGEERDRGIDAVLESITAQTGLRFNYETREFNIWHIIDEDAAEK